ncbi:GTPase HflX [Niameybacter massiliensis]|uniref:GTPase HflX n=1 Tax=Niameybacter massiliensis TaxID=1658108 RepID=UPI0006B58538|nr:GTPase HflX [Niameybacter massiliensis]
MEELKKVQERVILFAAQKKNLQEEAAWESLDELEELVNTAGGEVVAKVLQRVDSINPGLYIGSGKVEEIREMAVLHDVTGVISDDELSPVQMRNLSEALGIKVMDRTLVILDIFAQRARSKEGKLQVEMAQLKYQNSRLTGFGAMLSKQGGGIGTRGPGEKKLELDKRHIRTRMELLQAEIDQFEKHRQLLRSRRQKNSTPVVAIVGYTNAGKSTLLNTLADSDIYAADQLFATLDPTTRAVALPSGSEILLTDTVGFIRKLPHHLVKAFYSTLEEAKYADIILHVVDASSEHLATHYEVVHETLKSLGITDIPIITVYNKIDKVNEHYLKDEQSMQHVEISAREKKNLEGLLNILEEMLYEKMKAFKILIPYAQSDLVAFCHAQGERLEEEYLNEGVLLSGYMHSDLFYRIKDYIVD